MKAIIFLIIVLYIPNLLAQNFLGKRELIDCTTTFNGSNSKCKSTLVIELELSGTKHEYISIKGPDLGFDSYGKSLRWLGVDACKNIKPDISYNLKKDSFDYKAEILFEPSQHSYPHECTLVNANTTLEYDVKIWRASDVYKIKIIDIAIYSADESLVSTYEATFK